MNPGLGRAILNGIMREHLVTAPHENVMVWNANTDEMLEAIVADFEANSRPCSQCGNYAVLGETWNDAFTCCDCLPTA